MIRWWLRRRFRKRPFPVEWFAHLERHVPFYAALPDRDREDFLEKLKVFVWEKRFIGAGGLEMSDEVRVVVGAVAVRLILRLDLSYYDRLSEIVVYPHEAFRRPDSDLALLGEAHHWGVVVLSWPAVLAGLRNPVDGMDTGVHEFAHALDRASGQFDGTPVLKSLDLYRPWAEVMSKHFLNLRKGRAIERKVLDEYGALNEAEFFAVATEAFFEKPEQMQERLPDLYAELARFYGYESQ